MTERFFRGLEFQRKLWDYLHSDYNERNLEYEGMREIPEQPAGSSCVLVHRSHPVMVALVNHADRFHFDIRDMRKVEDEWYKIDSGTFHECCKFIRAYVMPQNIS